MARNRASQRTPAVALGADKSPLAWGAAGLELAHVGRHTEAADAFGHALRKLDEAADADPIEAHLLRAEWIAARMASRIECAEFEEADGALLEVRERLRSWREARPDVADERARRAEATALLNLARAQIAKGQLNDARAVIEQVFATLHDQAAPLLRAQAECQLGRALAIGGMLGAALDCWDTAAARLAPVGEATDHLLRARLGINRALVLADLARFAESAMAFRDVMPLCEGLAATGRAGAQAELARAWRSVCFLHGHADRHVEAAAASDASLAAYSRALRVAAPPATRAAMRVSRCGVMNSRGYTLLRLGKIDEARAVLRCALRELAREQATTSLRTDELARARINLAHVEAHLGRLVSAQRLYSQAQHHFANRRDGDAAPIHRREADLGLARVALRRGRVADAAQLFNGAMGDLAALTHEGALQHERVWLEAWLAQRDAWLATGPAFVRDAADTASATSADPNECARSGDAKVARMLELALATPPRHAAGLGAEPLRAVVDAARATCSPLLPPPPVTRAVDPHALEQVAVAYLKHLFGWMRTLLADTDPHWVRRHADAVDAAIDALRDNAAQRTDASAQLAQWFLATRGLRAARSALADGDDPALIDLRERLQELHRIEQEILGERGDATAAGSGGAPSVPHAATRAELAPTLPAVAAPQGGSPDLGRPGVGRAALADTWQRLAAQVREARSTLRANGLLPEHLDLGVGGMLDALASGQALLLLARPAPARLLVIALHRMPGAAAAIEHDERRLDAELAVFSCRELHAIARMGWSSEHRVAAAPADRFALQMFERLWLQGVEPIVRRLVSRGVRSIDLVPSGDLHLVPWNHLVDRRTASPLQPAISARLFPSAGAWWRAAAEHRGDPSSAAAPRWVVAAGVAAADPPKRVLPGLPWVAAERQLSQRLWGNAMQPLAFDRDGRVAAADCDALLGMGHGHLPENNPARVGLVAGPAVLLPHHLLALHGCRHALLSACLLGHTDGTHGEALGFLSGCFDHRFVFAGGWLTEVPDQTACLFSLAAQWVLKQPVGAFGDAVVGDAVVDVAAAGRDGWSGRLAALRRELVLGRWPRGFGEWLGDQWTVVAPGASACPARPPPGLIRALPWAVALG